MTYEPDLLYFGTSPDGAAHYVRVVMAPGRAICPGCYGTGRVWMETSYCGKYPAGWEDCERCNASGEISLEDE